MHQVNSLILLLFHCLKSPQNPLAIKHTERIILCMTWLRISRKSNLHCIYFECSLERIILTVTSLHKDYSKKTIYIPYTCYIHVAVRKSFCFMSYVNLLLLVNVEMQSMFNPLDIQTIFKIALYIWESHWELLMVFHSKWLNKYFSQKSKYSAKILNNRLRVM